MTIKEHYLRILGKYKIIGDTTYGLGFKDSEELIDELLKLHSDFTETIRRQAFNRGYEEGKKNNL